ncbi:MAG: T9SS type A sorting domain-containing protein, partial [Bacteroidota bacterium]|nr:T9SS type A sorting domain-containing protein [Bacteroidota bacterium]
EGTIQMYNFMQGRIGKTGQFFVTPEGKPTTFANTGDPVAGTGWLDGTQSPAGDRRLGLSSGPFTMAAGDTQEVVVAEIAAEGSDRLQSVKLLKSYDARAQQAYNNFFKIPTGAAPPVVQATELNREVVLSWGDPINAEKTESYNANGYKFQGYNVYQLPSPSAGKDESKLIATFDLVDQISTIYDYVFDPRTGKPELTPVQFGTNSGIKRSFVVNKDYLNGNVPLNNGTRYYYAVTSYSFNPDSGVIPNVLENPLSSITVTPHALNPGVRYPAITGDTLKTVVHRAGSSDASVTPLIVDPSKLTGHSYKVTFQVFKVPDPATGGIRDSVVWAVFDSTANKYVEQNQNNISGNANYFIFDGIQLIVQGPPPGMKDYAIPSGTRKWSFSGGNFNLEGFSGAIGNAYNNWFSGSTVTPDKLYDVLIKFATTDSLGNITDQNDANASFAYRYLRRASQPPRYPSFAPFIKNKTAGYAFQDYTKTMPFAAYNAVTNQRLMVGYLENNDTLGTVDGKYWPPSTDQGIDNTAATGPREWFFIFDVPYSTTPDTALEKDILNTTLPIAWMGTPTRRGAASVAFSSKDQFLIISNKLISASDVFSFTTPPVTSGNTAYALEDVKMINVFPNPYYGVNPQEINKYQRFVTFSHLPQTATIRIFNVAGQLVRTIARDNSASQFERWDLNNENGLPVGSGMYIAHIDMGPLGSKILKLAVIQEQQVLDRF